MNGHSTRKSFTTENTLLSSIYRPVLCNFAIFSESCPKRRGCQSQQRDEISQLIKSKILRTRIFIIIWWDDESFSPSCNYCGYAQIQDERINEAVQCSFVCRILFCSQKFSSLVCAENENHPAMLANSSRAERACDRISGFTFASYELLFEHIRTQHTP